MMRHFLTSAVFMVAIVSSVAAQDGASALPQNYKVLLDNDEMQVVRVHYNPHEALPVHDHSHYPTVYVYLSDSGPARFIHDGAVPYTLTRRPVKKGWFRVSPGRIERHQAANMSPTASDFLRVECKPIPLGQIAEGFRYSQDVDLTKTSMATDYSSPEMVIRRYVITPGGVEHVAAEARGELLIAFTPVMARERGKKDERMAAASVSWIQPNASFDLRAAGSTSAHVLAIRLLN